MARKVSAIHMQYHKSVKKVSAIPSIAILYHDINSPAYKAEIQHQLVMDDCICIPGYMQSTF